MKASVFIGTSLDGFMREVIVAGDFGIERGSFTWKVAPVAGGSQIEDRGHSWLCGSGNLTDRGK